MGLALEARYRVDSGNADGVKHSQTATSGKAFGSSNAWGAFFIEEARVSSHPDAEVNYIERAKTLARRSENEPAADAKMPNSKGFCITHQPWCPERESNPHGVTTTGF